MVQPTRRRESNPDMVQKLWESIAYIRHQKQIPNLDRIAKYILRVHNIKYGEVYIIPYILTYLCSFLIQL